MSRDNRGQDTVLECIEALHATGYGDLGDELEHLFREELHRYNKALGYIKKALYTTIFVGGTVLTIGGTAWMVLQRDPYGALVFLGIGLALLTVTGLMLAMLTAFEEHLESEFKEKRIETMTMIDRIEKANSKSERDNIRDRFDR